ncbi:MAG: response regulator [Devosia sp.]|nr:response regulator [Devosia sp.]
MTNPPRAEDGLDPFSDHALPRARDIVKVLLVDDDPVDVALVKQASLGGNQMDLFYVACATIPVAMTALAHETFDVAMVDYWLGHETSIALIQDVRREFGLPCILLTGLDTPDIRRIGFRAGAAGFLAKDGLFVQAIESAVLSALNTVAPRPGRV